MASNIYTKNEILQTLASKGYFIDVYTLNTFFTKWNIEAIFEDEQGGEFFDKNALDMVLNNLFNAKNEEVKKENNENKLPKEPASLLQTHEVQPQQFRQTVENIPFDTETQDILNNISLSDGSPLIDKVQENLNLDIAPVDTVISDISSVDITPVPVQVNKKKKTGILEGAMQTLDETTQQEIKQGQELRQEVTKEMEETEKTIADFQNQTQQILPENNTLNIQENIPPMPQMPLQPESQNSADFDDISLLSDSIEVQEKFKEYVVSEFTKKQGMNPTPPVTNNEFKLDISERTISMIARTMAKKIAKHVSSICSIDTKTAARLEEIKQENKRLEQKTKELESQNKKLKLLLAESNKNLNSYKPSIFGLYKKVPPQQN